MLKPKALMESASSSLHIFLEKTGENLSLPDTFPKVLVC